MPDEFEQVLREAASLTEAEILERVAEFRRRRLQKPN